LTFDEYERELGMIGFMQMCQYSIWYHICHRYEIPGKYKYLYPIYQTKGQGKAKELVQDYYKGVEGAPCDEMDVARITAFWESWHSRVSPQLKSVYMSLMEGTLSMEQFHKYLERWLPTPRHLRTGTFRDHKDVKKEPGVAPRDPTTIDLTQEDPTETKEVDEELAKSTASLSDFRIRVTKDAKGRTVRRVIRPGSKEGGQKSNIKGKGKESKEASSSSFRSKDKEQKEEEKK